MKVIQTPTRTMKHHVATILFFLTTIISGLEAKKSFFGLNYRALLRSGAEFECPGVGYFPDVTDHTCQQYFYCATKNSLLVAYTYKCSGSSNFDPSAKRCSYAYECPYTSPAFPMSTTPRPYVCSKPGRFPNAAKNCTGYIYCGKKCNNKYVMSYYDCPKSTFFDPVARACSKQRPIVTLCASVQINLS